MEAWTFPEMLGKKKNKTLEWAPNLLSFLKYTSTSSCCLPRFLPLYETVLSSSLPHIKHLFPNLKNGSYMS